MEPLPTAERDEPRPPAKVVPLREDEREVEKSLRPKTLREFIGQRDLVENLRIAIFSAKRRGDVLDHILLSGMPGLGKTTLSNLMAQEMGTRLHVTSGPAVGHGEELVGLLTGLKRGDVLFIDEIHRLSREAEEHVYSAMEDLEVHVVLPKGPESRALRIRLDPFTLVGATTREGMLSAPFRSRFGLQEKLELYPPQDLVEILTRSAGLLGCRFGVDAAEYLARHCRGTPRHANRFLRRVRDLALYRGDADDKPILLSIYLVKEALRRLGIDEQGLERADRRILEVLLLSDKPVGLKTIAVQVGEEEHTVEDVYEPYLMQEGFLLKTARGRMATAKAREIYGRGPHG